MYEFHIGLSVDWNIATLIFFYFLICWDYNFSLFILYFICLSFPFFFPCINLARGLHILLIISKVCFGFS